MKSLFSRIFIIALTLIFSLGLGLSLSSSTLAEEILPTTLELKLEALTTTLEKVFVQEQKADEPSFDILFYAGSPGQPFGPCMYDTSGLPSSNQYNPDADWDITFMLGGTAQVNSSLYDGMNAPREQYVDLNGDGLTDYYQVYIPKGTTQSRMHQSCVLLNNGRGWDPAFRCVATFSKNETTGVMTQNYQGDCALTAL